MHRLIEKAIAMVILSRDGTLVQDGQPADALDDAYVARTWQTVKTASVSDLLDRVRAYTLEVLHHHRQLLRAQTSMKSVVTGGHLMVCCS